MALKQTSKVRKPIFTESEIVEIILNSNNSSSSHDLDLKLISNNYIWKLFYSGFINRLKKSKRKGLIHRIPVRLIHNKYLKLFYKYYLLDKYSRSLLMYDKDLIKLEERESLGNFTIAVLIHKFESESFDKLNNFLFKFLLNLNTFSKEKQLEYDIKINRNTINKQYFYYYFHKYLDFNNIIKKFFNSLEIILILLALNISERNYTFTKSIYSNVKNYLSNETYSKSISLDRSIKTNRPSVKDFLPSNEHLIRYDIKTVKINKIIKESNNIKTLSFNVRHLGHKYQIPPKPGQFIMLWTPGVDEKPMSISNYDNKGNWSVTIKNVGKCTEKIHKLEVGAFIGIRGPLGNYFNLPDNKNKIPIIIGGGIGMAPLKFLAFELKNKGYDFEILQGATCTKESIFIEEYQQLIPELINITYCTDDGSLGEKGNVAEIFRRYIAKTHQEKISNLIVFTCGPEKMMQKIFNICEEYNIKLQASLERVMRCGSGLCGLCALDPLGLLVCKDGPIFNSETLKEIQDFGKYKRDFAGKKISL
ncbi:MAG: dihydroorotate dehydrogenase electron transfer subunit [Promethearchaeota archaeon Loki_b32]|nr:MAG: dihydroorotate dehydrogenase electron transfer subunit [Candidatus Lokiarchaeota archaeon Loki_b32]